MAEDAEAHGDLITYLRSYSGVVESTKVERVFAEIIRLRVLR